MPRRDRPHCVSHRHRLIKVRFDVSNRKYTYCYHPEAAYSRGQLNFQGNNAKSMFLSFQSSLKRLKTEYIGESHLT